MPAKRTPTSAPYRSSKERSDDFVARTLFTVSRKGAAVMIAQSKHFSGRHGYQFFGSSTAFSYHQLESAGWASTNAHQLYASGRLVRITLPPKEQLL